MSVLTKLKSTSGLLGIAGMTMAGLVSACDQQSSSNNLVEKSEDGACVVARLAEARAGAPENMEAKCNPCAAGQGCNPCAAEPSCNPCAAANCNPCAASGCNPCAAKAGCNPCAAANPCAASACNPCTAANPCAAKGGCNPCAGVNPCNPCAASACNPCAGVNPCNPCAGVNPCNPCAPGNGGKELSPEEASAAYECFKGEMKTGYGMSGEDGAADYQGWSRYNTSPYVSLTHGGRYVNNYANNAANSYGRFEDAGTMPVGAIIAKDSFVVGGDGTVSAGPLFLMKKMDPGFMPEYGDWKYTMIIPDGSTWGATGGKNSSGMQFCIDCHVAAEDYDYLFFLPGEFRKE